MILATGIGPPHFAVHTGKSNKDGKFNVRLCQDVKVQTAGACQSARERPSPSPKGPCEL